MSEFHGSGSFTLVRPSIGSWHHKKSNLYKETLLDVTNSLKINADDFNAAADAAVEHRQSEVKRRPDCVCKLPPALPVTKVPRGSTHCRSRRMFS